ncbi:MAG: hypothetical protein LBM78_03295 [Clostridiales bacterium]|jgi:hypothetical protein|nr:hypothetical protein [Clostridiales bacterium]
MKKIKAFMLAGAVLSLVAVSAACAGAATPQKALDNLIDAFNKRDTEAIADACLPAETDAALYALLLTGLRSTAESILSVTVTTYSLRDVREDGGLAVGTLTLGITVQEEREDGSTVTKPYDDIDVGKIYFTKLSGRWYVNADFFLELLG